MSKVPVVITRSLQMIRMLDNKVGERAQRVHTCPALARLPVCARAAKRSRVVPGGC
jgi:hypothetical protein